MMGTGKTYASGGSPAVVAKNLDGNQVGVGGNTDGRSGNSSGAVSSCIGLVGDDEMGSWICIRRV